MKIKRRPYEKEFTTGHLNPYFFKCNITTRFFCILEMKLVWNRIWCGEDFTFRCPLYCLVAKSKGTVRRVFLQTNICGHCYWFFWLQWAGNLAVAGLNLLSQISDVMSSKDWQGISQLFGSFFCYRFCISQICS